MLSDPEKRQLYDLGGESALGGHGGTGPGFGFSDIFETFFGAAAGAANRAARCRGAAAARTRSSRSRST